ncbi:MAG: tripartite tricarboxylate transporter substrate binding protein [Rhodoplanes sp.]|uniref:Bug family tripartite tricarboxylate transporter substrate binding protein n=1 Tax=Rhodoplanes sp. TaxID=1968906 RepID=UPI00180396BF|nr:tripartite tricarboxylate transporter substrate-binding protein [Rhodoplanes sp.]NVO15034.1 tripartite tricarboxylate transporter substrate binding protein [Rhodoplanes sp.]
MKSLLVSWLAAASLLAAAPPPAAQAQSVSTSPMKLIVGASPGGSTDMLARGIADELGRAMGRPVVVENKAGAGGKLAALEVARSTPDGTTLLVSFTSHTINAALFRKPGYDPVADFTPITLLAKVSSVLVARPDHPAKDLRDLAARAKTDGQDLVFAIGGTGSSLHMDTYEFAAATGLKVTQVPFKGTSPAVTDVMAGHVDLMFAPVGTTRTLLEAGKLRALAVTGPTRVPVLAQTPPITDAVPNYTSNQGWFGVLGPAGMPPELTARIHAGILKALSDSKLRARLEADGSIVDGSGTEAFTAFLESDLKHRVSQVKAFGIEPE